MRTLLLATLLAVSALASPPHTQIWPSGPWPLCEAVPELPMCADFAPGNEQYMLGLEGTEPTVVGYQWTATATMKDGTTKVLSGLAQRADNANGWTWLTVGFGGVPAAIALSVQNVGVIE